MSPTEYQYQADADYIDEVREEESEEDAGFDLEDEDDTG